MTDKTTNTVGVDLNVNTSSQNVNLLIKEVKATGDKYNTAVQDAIVAVIEHCNNYQDCTGAARLLAAMPRSNRRQLVIDHFAQYSPINVTKDSKTETFKATLRKPFFDKAETKPDDKYRPYDIDGVRANNWWERAGAEKLPDVIDYDSIRTKMLTFFESQLRKAEKCENDDDRQKAVAYIKVIRSAASNYNAQESKTDNLKGTEWDDDAAIIKAA